MIEGVLVTHTKLPYFRLKAVADQKGGSTLSVLGIFPLIKNIYTLRTSAHVHYYCDGY